MSPSEFDKIFKHSSCYDERKETWVSALRCVREHRGNFDIQLAEWIAAELKANGVE